MKAKLLITILILLTTILTFGNENSRKNEMSLGIGIAVFSKPYKGKDVEVFPLPLFDYKRGNFYIQGIEIGYMLNNSRTHQWNIFATPEFGGYEISDSDYFEGMEKRDKTLNLGIKYTYNQPKWSMDLSASGDVLGKSDGITGEWKITRRIFKNRAMITPAAGIQYMDSNYADYYFGVRQNEATGNRPAYQPDASTNLFLSLGYAYKTRGRMSVIGMLKYTSFGSEIKNSPLTDSSSETVAFFGCSWAF